jgi:sodium/pantothenate symporter
MAACLALSIALALFRPPLIQWIILFSIGGLEAATFAPLLLGMFWKRGTTIGAIASVVWGMIIYALGNTVFPQLGVWGAHPSLVSVLSALVVYVIVSLLTPRPSENVVWTFWGKPRSSP